MYKAALKLNALLLAQYHCTPTKWLLIMAAFSLISLTLPPTPWGLTLIEHWELGKWGGKRDSTRKCRHPWEGKFTFCHVTTTQWQSSQLWDFKGKMIISNSTHLGKKKKRSLYVSDPGSYLIDKGKSNPSTNNVSHLPDNAEFNSMLNSPIY